MSGIKCLELEGGFGESELKRLERFPEVEAIETAVRFGAFEGADTENLSRLPTGYDRAVKFFLPLKKLRALHFYEQNLSEHGTVFLREIRTLERLWIELDEYNGANIDQCVTDISQLTQLRHLTIFGATLKDEHIRLLAKLNRLQHLHLLTVELADKTSWQVIGSLTELDTLRLNANGRSSINPAHLVHLYGLKRLRYLELPLLPDWALKQLRQKLPFAQISCH